MASKLTDSDTKLLEELKSKHARDVNCLSDEVSDSRSLCAT